MTSTETSTETSAPALTGERARHRVQTDEPRVATAVLGDDLARDRLALDELAEPVQAGRQRDQDLAILGAELDRAPAGVGRDRVVVDPVGRDREHCPVLGGAEPARGVAQDGHGERVAAAVDQHPADQPRPVGPLVGRQHADRLVGAAEPEADKFTTNVRSA